jgi:TPR repeat protein
VTIKQSLKLSFACALLFLALSPLHAQNETPAQAAARYQERCDGGNPNDCMHLSDAYVAGTGVTKDLDKATALLSKLQACFKNPATAVTPAAASPLAICG